MLSNIIKASTTTSRGLFASKAIIPKFQSLRSKRFIFSKNNILFQKKQGKSTKQPQSILTDDLLTRAGIDIDDPSLSTKNGSQSIINEINREDKDDAQQQQQDNTDENQAKKFKRSRKTTTELKRERYANWFYIFSFSAIGGYALYMTRDWEDNEPQELKDKVANGYTASLMYGRFKARFSSIFTYFQEPPFPDLLPPPPPPPYQRPLTLVLSLEDLLVHSEWTQKNGWRTAKRPGVDYFLGYLSQYYEIVLFSSNYMMYSEKIAEKLDPLHAFISYNLYKEHCVYKNHTHIKDLSKLNRDVNKVIIIDTNPDSYKLQPENAIPMKPWKGEYDDKLIQLIPFLEYLATQQVSDVKPILNSFKDKYNIPLEFHERVNKLRTKFLEEQEKRTKGNWALRLLGVANTVSSTSKFPLDLIREEGEKNYIRFMKLIEEEKEKMRIQQEKMSGQTFTLKDYVEGNIPTPEQQMEQQAKLQKEVDEIYEQRKKERGETN